MHWSCGRFIVLSILTGNSAGSTRPVMRRAVAANQRAGVLVQYRACLRRRDRGYPAPVHHIPSGGWHQTDRPCFPRLVPDPELFPLPAPVSPVGGFRVSPHKVCGHGFLSVVHGCRVRSVLPQSVLMLSQPNAVLARYRSARRYDNARSRVPR